MGVQNRVLEVAAGHPIPAGPRGVAVQGRVSFLSKNERAQSREII